MFVLKLQIIKVHVEYFVISIIFKGARLWLEVCLLSCYWLFHTSDSKISSRENFLFILSVCIILK